MLLGNFELSMLRTITKYHAFPFSEIEKVYLEVNSFDKVIKIVNLALAENLSLGYMTDLFQKVEARS